MGNDPGRGGRSDEPPPLATVRRLHLDDVDGSAAATDEWYETERLTGHITGGARSAPTADRPAPSQAAAPVVLDWRHASAGPPPTALQRLGRTLASRPRRRGPQDSDVPSPARTRGAQPVSVLATASQIEPPTTEPEEAEPRAEETAAPPSGPRIGLRESVDASGPEHRPHPHPRLRRAAIVIAVVLSVAAVSVSVIGIVAETSRATPKSHPTSLTAATSRPSDAGLNTAAKTVTGALETLAHQADMSQRQRRTVRARRRTRHPTTRGRARHSSRRAAINRRHSAPPVTTPTTTPSTSGSSSVSPASTSSYSSSSSSPAYSSQPAASESAPTAKSVPLPAGPLGPGGTVGTNCNPKCS
jgi:hypothetical protein